MDYSRVAPLSPSHAPATGAPLGDECFSYVLVRIQP